MDLLGKEIEKLPPRIKSAPISTIQRNSDLSGVDQSFKELVLYSIRYTSGGDLTYGLETGFFF